MLMLEPASILTLESFRRLPPIVHKGNPGFIVSFGWMIFVLAVFLFWLAHKTKIGLPAFVKSGKALAVLTWVALVLTASIWLVDLNKTISATLQGFARERNVYDKYNVLSAIESVRRLTLAEARYQQKHPKLEFTCELEELPGISILSFTFTRKPMPLTLSCQSQIARASLRW